MPVEREGEEEYNEDSSDVSESEDDEAMEDEESEKKQNRKTYIPNYSRPLKEDEDWEFDPEAYKLFHSFQTTYPCLSFDIVHDELGENRTELPVTATLIAGTQTRERRKNELLVMRLSNLLGIKPDESDDDEDASDDEDNVEGGKKTKKDNPRLHAAVIPHFGGINRIRAKTIGTSQICAVWNEMAKVQLWNISSPLKDLSEMDDVGRSVKYPKERPIFSCVNHKAEGFGLAWSSLETGTLASGDIRGEMYIWKMGDGGMWSIDKQPYKSHSGHVEDIAWSPTESALLVTCSTDSSIKLWDIRSPPSEACVCTVEHAHESDVNVLSWNKHEPILVSGGDDAALNIWSLKTIQYGEPVARFKHHKGAITSVEWCPQETTTLIASGEDDQITIWDLAVEAEGSENIPEVPPQLLFVHMGQTEIKEVHFHSQVPGLVVSTAESGFDVFKTISV